jgi:hypothetical protein
MITPENPSSPAAANLDLSQAGLVVPDPNQQKVWYASYGSNMRWKRFKGYIDGKPVPGVARVPQGSSDPTPPSAVEAIELPQGLYFGAQSFNWLDDEGNERGAGFTTLDERPKGALGRAYLITLNQFMDVVAQENGMPVGSLAPLDIDKVKDAKNVEMFPEDLYSHLQYGGEMMGDPIMSFTGNHEHDLSHPSDGYAWVIGQGLIEAHGLREEQAAEYIANAPGAVGHFTVNGLANILAGEQPISKFLPKH